MSNNDCLDDEEMLAVAIKMTLDEEDDEDADEFPSEQDIRQERDSEEEGNIEEAAASYTPVVNLDAEIVNATELSNRQRCLYLQTRDMKSWSRNGSKVQSSRKEERHRRCCIIL